MSSSFGALRGAVRNRNLLHAHLAQFCLVARGVEPCVTSHQLRNTPELLFVFLHRRHQEVGIIGPLGEHLVMGDDLILRFLNLDHLPVLGSNILTSFPATWTSPPSTRALLCRITCRTRGNMVSKSFRSPCRTNFCS